MTTQILKSVTLLTFILLLSVDAHGQQRRQFPNSPRGNALSDLVTVIETGSPSSIRSFVETRLSPALLGRQSVQEWVDRISGIAPMLPGMGVRDLAPLGRTGLSVSLYSRSNPNEVGIELDLDNQSTPMFTELTFTNRVMDNSPLSLDGVSQELSDYLETLSGEEAFSGAVALSRNGQPVSESYFGTIDLNRDAPPDANTRFNVASMGKMFTAVAIAQLKEAGKLAYSDPVSRHYPEFPWSDYADKITIDHLLTHRSGLGNYDFGHGQTDVEKVVQSAQGEPVAFEPGSRMGYSNTGFAVLGVIIERASGMNYHDYITEHVFKKAGMTRSGFFSPAKPVDNMALGYTMMNADGTPRKNGRGSNANLIETIGSPGGGAYSTVTDMIRFGDALTQNELLSEDTRIDLWKGRSDMGPGMQYAYGFGNSARDGVHSIGHNGGGPGIGADFRIYPELNLTSIAFTNYDADPIMPLSGFLTRLLARLSE